MSAIESETAKCTPAQTRATAAAAAASRKETGREAKLLFIFSHNLVCVVVSVCGWAD